MQIRFYFCVIALVVCASANAGDWPAFRGPQGNGVAAGSGYATEWTKEKNVKWRVELSEPGNGSPIVSHDRIFLSSADEDGHQRSLICFERESGKQLWTQSVKFGEDITHRQNPFGSATPVSDGKHVVVWHGSAGLYCYDFSGKELWSRKLGTFKHIWGYGSSPVIYQDKVILHCGPGERVFLTAIELSTGKTLWEKDEVYQGDKKPNDIGSWSTPVVARVDGADQIIHSTATRVNGYNPKTGEVIWWCEGVSGSRYDAVSSSPLIANGVCVVMADLRGPAFGFKIGGQGDITESNRLWLNKRNPSSVGTGIFSGKYVYRPNSNPGTLECLDATTGKKAWAARAASGNYWSSMVLADGNLYATTQKGTTVVFKPNPEKLEEVSRNDLEETCNSTPAFSDSQIFIRTYEALYCIGQ